MPPTGRRSDVPWLTIVPTLQPVLDEGQATRGLTAKVRGSHVIVGRVDDAGADQRFRLTPLGGGRYGLSLYHRNRWDPLPYQGTLSEMVEVMNNELGAWAPDWPNLPS